MPYNLKRGGGRPKQLGTYAEQVHRAQQKSLDEQKEIKRRENDLRRVKSAQKRAERSLVSAATSGAATSGAAAAAASQSQVRSPPDTKHNTKQKNPMHPKKKHKPELVKKRGGGRPKTREEVTGNEPCIVSKLVVKKTAQKGNAASWALAPRRPGITWNTAEDKWRCRSGQDTVARCSMGDMCEKKIGEMLRLKATRDAAKEAAKKEKKNDN